MPYARPGKSGTERPARSCGLGHLFASCSIHLNPSTTTGRHRGAAVHAGGDGRAGGCVELPDRMNRIDRLGRAGRHWLRRPASSYEEGASASPPPIDPFTPSRARPADRYRIGRGPLPVRVHRPHPERRPAQVIPRTPSLTRPRVRPTSGSPPAGRHTGPCRSLGRWYHRVIIADTTSPQGPASPRAFTHRSRYRPSCRRRPP